MPVEDVVSSNGFSMFYANQNPDKLKHTHFLVLDDKESTAPIPTRAFFRGARERTFTITSPVDQEIWVTANTWADRSIPSKCGKAYGRKLVLYNTGNRQAMYLLKGAHTLSKMKVTAD
jgi:hypothetical protein